VLTRQATIPVLNAVLAVPATRTIRSIPTEVVLDRADGMPAACALSLDNVIVVPKELSVPGADHAPLDRADGGGLPGAGARDRVRRSLT
jgi:mRNA-degrading endonuclease toxin of MazEF toxin-antitoxin module